MRRAGPLAALFLAGCSTIGSLGGGNRSHTDDVWFTRVRSLFMLQLSSSVWYCPAPTRPGPATCIEAVLDGPVPDEATATMTASADATTDAPPAAAPAAAPVVTAERPAAPPSAPASTSCHDMTLPDIARPVTDVTVRGALPATTGGTIADGLYVLVRTESHRSFANLFERRMAVRIRSGAFEAISVRGSEAPQSARGTLRVSPGGRLTFAVDCPASGQMEYDHYTVTDDGLVLQDQETQRIVLLAREELPAANAPAAVSAAPTSEPAPEAAPATPAAPEPTAPAERRRHGRRRH